MPIHSHLFRQVVLTEKVSQTGLVFGVLSGLINRSEYARLLKSLCAAVTIFATMVNIETHKYTDGQHFDQLI